MRLSVVKVLIDDDLEFIPTIGAFCCGIQKITKYISMILSFINFNQNLKLLIRQIVHVMTFNFRLKIYLVKGSYFVNCIREKLLKPAISCHAVN